MNITKKLWIYHVMAIVTVVVWGTTFVSTKILLTYGLSPMEILLYRFSLAYIGIWFFSPRKILSRNFKDELLFVAAGLCGGSLYFVSENTALGITLASNVSLIICTSPILTAFLSFLFYKKEKLQSKLVWGSLMAFAGVALVVFNGSFILKINPIGDMLTVIAALMWAFYGFILKRLDSHYPVLFITRKVFFYGILTLLPMFWFKPIKTEWIVLTQPVVFLNLLFLGLIASMLCYIMWNTTVKQLGVIRATNYIYIVPLVTLLTSAIVIDETITMIGLLGSVLILNGVYVAERGVNAFKFLSR
ncbi:DMT family transporter [Parabacteroides bouchesdurhonensis]|uniref:DMT family transporter n=1 Tax=Parabacteroides bouchesdurhonensis TaxID=1936995 RepID=UPI000E4BB1DA|nr:DMT family transporter [Parabacteroides bouchesdurhonensis]RHJ90275.1 DMT family transporter [Bacteroides sp. AM07-16]